MFIQLDQDILIKFKGETRPILKGDYIYVGSAFGTGGLSSRLHRHLRKNKKEHWHIDQVTMNPFSKILGVYASINREEECLLASKLSKISNIVPIEGFGNSDCKNKCNSHFFQVLG